MMYIAMISGALFLAGGYWLTEYGYHKCGSPLSPDSWLVISFSVTALLFGYLLLRIKSKKHYPAELLLFVALFGASNLCQWDKNHSGWGISAEGSNPTPGLFGTFEPVVYDFTDRQISDRLTTILLVKRGYPTLWSEYKAAQIALKPN